MPTALFQGSLLLGSVAQAVLGPAATGAAAFVHPALIAGWAGLVGSALNSLPVGSLDGGRMIQARIGSCACAVGTWAMPATACLWSSLYVASASYTGMHRLPVGAALQCRACLVSMPLRHGAPSGVQVPLM